MNPMIQKTASFLRWRLVPIRYLGRLRRLNRHNFNSTYLPKSTKAQEIERVGFTSGPVVEGELLRQLQSIYLPRIDAVKNTKSKAPFVNLSRPEDITADNPLMKLAFSPSILDVALDYYSGHCRLDKLQVLYSFPSDRKDIKESQMWHLDFSDTRSFHSITYLNDVLDNDGGPFVFVDKNDTKRIRKGPIIRRIDDSQFQQELGDGVVRSFYGRAGETVMMDPAVCYHYGSRCKVGRGAIFATFSSDKPFAPAMPLITENTKKILEVAIQLRPDLDRRVLEQLVDV